MVRHIHRAASAEAAALAGGRLLSELAEEAHAVAAAGTAPQRLSVYAGHDSSIIALLAVLGAYQNGRDGGGPLVDFLFKDLFILAPSYMLTRSTVTI